MPILSILTLALGSLLSFAHAVDDAAAAELRRITMERRESERRVNADLHARALELSNDAGLRLMMAVPTRLPESSVAYFLETHPALPIEHVFETLVEVARLEVEFARRRAVDLGAVRAETNRLIARAVSALKPSSRKARPASNNYGALGPEITTAFVDELSRLEVKPSGATPTLPPLVPNLVAHLRRAEKTARRGSKAGPGCNDPLSRTSP